MLVLKIDQVRAFIRKTMNCCSYTFQLVVFLKHTLSLRGRTQTTWPFGGSQAKHHVKPRGGRGGMAEKHVTFPPHFCIFVLYQTRELSFTARAKPSDYHTVGGGRRKGFVFLSRQLFFLRFYSNLILSSRLKHESSVVLLS